jgi:UDP-N-acetylglucosamine 2-epimerase
MIAVARPNFMKIAPKMKVFEECKYFGTMLVQTGHLYDLSRSLFAISNRAG